MADDLIDDKSKSIAPKRGQQRSSIHIAKPDKQWCSCGVWQEFMYSCRRGCAVYRKRKEKQFDYVLANMVHPYYKFKFVKETFRNDVFPVSLDAIEYHGVTEPPTRSIKRQPGRPRIKRICRRSEFLDPEDLPVICSKCGN